MDSRVSEARRAGRTWVGWLGVWLWLALAAGLGRSQSAAEWADRAEKAGREGRLAEALLLANLAVEQGPKNAQVYSLRGRLRAEADQPARAVVDFDRVLELRPHSPEIFHLRGREEFRLGAFDKAIADFDRFLEFLPARRPYHWQRGIACYYAGRYGEGKKQFEVHQTVNSNDVENAVWHFLCNARLRGMDEARAALMRVDKGGRVPLTQIYALFAGQVRPEDVLLAALAETASGERSRREFYAHFYVGLYFEAAGQRERARKHISFAAEHYRLNDFMWEVARVHARLLRRDAWLVW